MRYEVVRTDVFGGDLKAIFKKYKKSSSSIEAFLDSLAENPQGDRIPGFAEVHLKKARIPLKEYRIGESGGLRLVYLLIPEKFKIVPVHIYSKSAYKGEQKVVANVRRNLRMIFQELAG